MLFFRKIPVSKNSMDKRGGYQEFPSNFFVSQRRKLWQGNPFVSLFGKLPVARKTMDKRGRGVSRFSVEFFCTTVPKTFAKETFCVLFQKTSGSEKDSA